MKRTVVAPIAAIGPVVSVFWLFALDAWVQWLELAVAAIEVLDENKAFI